VMLTQFEHGAISGPNRDVLREVLKISPTLALEAALAGPGVDTKELVRDAITKHFYDQVSNHGAKAVAAAAQRMGGSAKAIWDKVEAAGEAQPAADLHEWTDKRHQIVHQGKAVRINRDPARSCIQLIQRIAAAIDEMACEVIAAAVPPLAAAAPAQLPAGP